VDYPLCLRTLALATLLVGGGCHRLADEPYDFEALKIDACLDACDTLDTCDPDRFVGMEPEICFDRCMTLLPKLHEENQCGSRELIYLWCMGSLSCEGLAEFTEANSYENRDYTVPCVTEIGWSCSVDEPFDPDEPVPSHP
jgi:hypothetical protein